MKSGKKIIRIFSRLNIGGPSLHVVNLAAGLRDFNYETILIVGSPEKFEGDLMSYAQSQNVHPIFIKELQPAISPWRDLVAFVKIFKIIKKEKPDIIHTHTFKAGLLGRTAGLLLRVPVVIHTYHGHLLKGYGSSAKATVIKWIEKAMGLFTDKAIAVSQQVAQDLVRAKVVPARRMTAIELGFKLQTLEEQMKLPATLRQKHGIPQNAKVAAVIGRLVPVKAVDLFLQSLVPLLETNPDLHLAVIGHGPLMDELQNLARELTETCAEHFKRIHFCGWMVPLANEFKDIDICVCSSKNERTSVAIIESIICGVPVVSTHVGGMADLLENGKWGRLVTFDTKALRQSVEDLLRIISLADTDEEKIKFQQFLHKSSEAFKRRFDSQRLISEIAKLYDLESTKKSVMPAEPNL